ncbi:AI-2E family transporter [Janibacter cremeus]|uniref:Putative PurR-regulated permease PerM n=1 Tax=Janibacter cremeus TaxID=1285192 RepID=A0A852VU89_9MICO|nr:putative PurR-regulated permease PerM [Janibacter cremeus]
MIGEGLTWLARWSLRMLIVAAAAALAWWVLGALWVGVFPVLLALLVTSVMWPPTAWLRRHRVPSAVAAVIVLIGALAIFFGVLGAITPSLVSQSGELADSASKGLTDLQERAGQPPFNLDSATIDDGVESATEWLQARGGDIASGALAGASAVGGGLVTLILVLVLSFFFLKDGPQFLPFVRRVAGERAGAHLTEVASRSWTTLSGFIRTQALVSGVDAVFIGIGLVVLGVPLAFPLAILTFFAGFIPIVGAISLGALSVLVALVGKGTTTAVLVLVLIIVVQQLESNVLQPFLQGRSMQLHAGIILLSVAVGGTVFGIVGAFLAVPAAAVGAVIVRYLSEQANLRSGAVHPQDVRSETDEGWRAAERAERAYLQARSGTDQEPRPRAAADAHPTPPPGPLARLLDRLFS